MSPEPVTYVLDLLCKLQYNGVMKIEVSPTQGQWAPSGHDTPEWTGYCNRCQTMQPAVGLRPTGPSTWICAQGCDAVVYNKSSDRLLLAALRNHLKENSR